MSSLASVAQNQNLSSNPNANCKAADGNGDDTIENKSSCLPYAQVTANTLIGISTLALFIISCFVLAGSVHLSSQTLGTLSLSLTGVGLISSLAAFAAAENKEARQQALIYVIVSAAFMAVFALGLPHPSILSARTIAWINVIPGIIAGGSAILDSIYVCAACCCCASVLKGRGL